MMPPAAADGRRCMQLWQDGLMAMLAAVGLASIMWAVVRTVVYAGPERRGGVVALLPVKGDGEGLEEQVRALRGKQVFSGMVLIVDCGLSEEGRRLAKLLARGDRWVAVCTMEEIGSYLAA